MKLWRKNWANACNERLRIKGRAERIDHRTLKAQRLNREPTIHIGVVAKALEREGIITGLVRENREIIARNESRKIENTAERLHELKENHFIVSKEIAKLQEISAEARREMNVFRAKAEEMTERAEHIKNMKNRLEELKIKRQQMGFFTSKKKIDRQIQQQERAFEQSTSYFEQTYKIKREYAEIEAKRLETKADSKRVLL